MSDGYEVFDDVAYALLDGITLFTVQRRALVVSLDGSNDGDEHRIVKRSQRVLLNVGIRHFTRFVQADGEEPVITLLGGGEGLLIAEQNAEKSEPWDVPTHDDEAHGERRREQQSYGSPEPGPKNRGDDKGDRRNPGARTVKPRLNDIAANQFKRNENPEGE